MNALPWRVRAALLDDIPAMQAIEHAAGRLFSGIGMGDIAAHPPLDTGVLAAYVCGERAWIAARGGEPAGYAIADVVDGCGHLEQISVDPAYGRQGLGRMLIQTIIDWATAEDLPALTLLTFRDVAWNGPWYASLGFNVVADDELSPGLATLRIHERQLGLDPRARVAMYLHLRD